MQCEGKVGFSGPHSAKAALRRFARRGRFPGSVHVYLCGICCKYHIGRVKGSVSGAEVRERDYGREWRQDRRGFRRGGTKAR